MADEPVKVDAEDLWAAYEIADQGYPSAQGYVSSKTGKVYTVFGEKGLGDEDDEDDEDEGEENPPDLETSDEYLCVPSKRALGLGRDLVFDFAEEFMPVDYDEVRDIFSHAGAYRRFKDLVIRRKKLDAWGWYEEKRTYDALRAWCAENGMEMPGERIRPGPPAGSPKK